MRLSSTKAAHVTLTWCRVQEIRVSRSFFAKCGIRLLFPQTLNSPDEGWYQDRGLRHVLPLRLKSLRENYPLQIQSRRVFSACPACPGLPWSEPCGACHRGRAKRRPENNFSTLTETPLTRIYIGSNQTLSIIKRNGRLRGPDGPPRPFVPWRHPLNS